MTAATAPPVVERIAAATGVFGVLLGQLALWVEAHGKKLPAFLGWEMIVVALVCGVLMPESGGWLFLIPAVLVLLGARHASDSRG